VLFLSNKQIDCIVDLSYVWLCVSKCLCVCVYQCLYIRLGKYFANELPDSNWQLQSDRKTDRQTDVNT